MQTERLLLLADRVAACVPANFNMFSWRCGTAVCAGGLACTMPEFQARWLSCDAEYAYCPRFGMKRGFVALSEFFGLSDKLCKMIFDPNSYEGDIITGAIHPFVVAERIREIVAEYERQNKEITCT